MAHSTSATAFLTTEKSFEYRGAREHWSNAYHLDQVPPDTAAWTALMNAVVAEELAFLDSTVQLEAVYGHTPGTPPVLVFEYDPAPPGEGGLSGTFVPSPMAVRAPGDTAAWGRWSTTQKSTLGKPIYLRNYWHGVFTETSSDTWEPSQRALAGTFCNNWASGFNVNGVTYRRAGPRGAVGQQVTMATFVTTRTLKHRGRRHSWKTLPAGTTIQVPPIKVAPGWTPPELGIN